MGVIVKNTVLRPVRRDTLTQVRDKKIQIDLEEKGLLLRKQGIGVIVYAEADLVAFYEKHVLRQSREHMYTVLVKNETAIPSINEVRTLVEMALRIGTRGPDGRIVTPIPQISEKDRYGTRVWSGAQARFLDASSADRAFNFRDVVVPSSKKDIVDVCARVRIPSRECAQIVSMWEESFRTFPDGSPRVEYTVDYIWVVSKILIFKPGVQIVD